ncbi:MAG: threonylcarbamoyl-AMP synthase [Ruminococcaceae bacterium]|nr:threonylcarbamoyl-AMP synthase [Oscillospiraceae bacterium]
MITEKLYLDTDREESVKKTAEILKNGGIVALPTETVYGLAASALDKNAIKKVFEAKGRPQDNPLIVHINSIEMLKKVAKDIPKRAFLCAEKFWPGPFTMVLKSSGYVCSAVSAGLDTVAVRMPKDPVMSDVIARAEIPLAAPSANVSGSPSPVSAEHVINDLYGKIDAVVMGDRCSVGVESTVVLIEKDSAKLLRPGAVTLEMLKEILPDITVDKAILEEYKDGEKVASPGMKYKHYSPSAELYLIEGESKDFVSYVNKMNDGCALCFTEEEELIKVKTYPYGSINDQKGMAYEIFEILRRLDKEKIRKGYVHAPSKDGVGLAVYNRLVRACAHRVIKL